ncbi:TonB-dependent receptor [Pelobium sp.]|nr:TonB-dependent receptor [Pelobium sp.]MDA9555202.1 TonB-dependent receptor [Pelobium sp.]
MRRILFVLLMLFMQTAFAQNSLKVIIHDKETGKALLGATLSMNKLNLSTKSDSLGNAFLKNIPNGLFEISVSYVGYNPFKKAVLFNASQPDNIINVNLALNENTLEEVVIQSTRTDQSLQDIPTRIEALPLEELDEKSTMKPGDIKMLLAESTGIAVQPTSAVSGAANFRIQGLDSRYTQLLKDGMPLYQGFSGGLSILQITPLDLKQVEFVKGSASTLYGGGAIAGLVNLISKTPTAQPELTFLLNQTSAKGSDVSGFYAQKWKNIGTTVFGSYNYNGAYDPSGDGFTAIPQVHRFTINPKVFFGANPRHRGWFGVNVTHENRYAGDLKVIEGKADNIHQYFERNQSLRLSTQFSYTYQIDSAQRLNVKNTFGYFNRELTVPSFEFNGRQFASFSEINYVVQKKDWDWVSGFNIITDHFKTIQPIDKFNYNSTTLGLFGQNTWRANSWFSLESGIRVDYNTPDPNRQLKGFFILPRINGLFKIDEHFSSRIGGGLGYKMPNLFNDQSEQEGYQNLNQLNISATKAEQSIGANGDINFKGAIGDAYLKINQLFFYTVVHHPLILENGSFINSKGSINTKGAETNVKLSFDDLSFYLGYTYTDTKQNVDGLLVRQPLTAKHRISFDSVYEIENQWRIGAEGFYTGSQLLSNGTLGKSYLTFGLLIQKMWKHLEVFLNAENLTDRRQTRWDNIYDGSVSQPVFRDIYAPLDGIVVNAGVKIKLGDKIL